MAGSRDGCNGSRTVQFPGIEGLQNAARLHIMRIQLSSIYHHKKV